ncbi:hypothetical protein QBC34DRAFT_73531 [Podospora aff. communis PSN243]|uniref:Uncharacterized protein n=1 Tax=Podospora aff. communis PSN243 TaxID=3040156 RepID=A0AAV9H742_9PEZI|nr:hypothetical protein QBC34DRAFT_73531 [Podospora aff. communis PSN243]
MSRGNPAEVHSSSQKSGSGRFTRLFQGHRWTPRAAGFFASCRDQTTENRRGQASAEVGGKETKENSTRRGCFELCLLGRGSFFLASVARQFKGTWRGQTHPVGLLPQSQVPRFSCAGSEKLGQQDHAAVRSQLRISSPRPLSWDNINSHQQRSVQVFCSGRFILGVRRGVARTACLAEGLVALDLVLLVGPVGPASCGSCWSQVPLVVTTTRPLLACKG